MRRTRLWSASMLIMLAMLAGSIPLHAAEASDIRGHWAEKALKEWLDRGWLTGYKDGTVKPNKEVSRAELAALINKAFELKGASDAKFSDLPSTHWAKNAIATAIANGYLSGTGGDKVSPDRPAARQETAVMLAKLLQNGENKTAELPAFKDREQIASWSRSSVAYLISQNIMKGDTSNQFRPAAPLTRAEAVVAISNALDVYAANKNVVYTKKGTYGPKEGTLTIPGNATIKSASVTLQNVIIKGDLLISEEVGEGDASLVNVTVHGATTIKGGGPNSIHVQDSNLGAVIVNKQGGPLRLHTSGLTIVSRLILQSPAKVENTTISLDGLKKIEIDSIIPAKSELQFQGSFGQIDVRGVGIKLSASKGTIDRLVVDKNAKDGTFELDKTASLNRVELHAKSAFTGEGKIQSALISKEAESTTFKVKPVFIDKGKSNAGGGFFGGGGGGGAPGPNPGNGTETDDSRLSNLVVKDGTLLQRGEGYEIIGKGFKGTVNNYEVSVPVDEPSPSQTIEFTPVKKDAEVSVIVTYSDGSEEIIRPLAASFYSLDIPLKLKQNAHVSVEVKTNKLTRYNIFMKNASILKEDIKVLTAHYYYPDGTLFYRYYLMSERFNTGDQVTVTHNGQTIATCPVYYGFLDCQLQLQQSQGEVQLDMSIVKYNGEKLNVSYVYQAQRLAKLSQNADLGIKPLTRDELARNTDAGSGYKPVSGVKFQWDSRKTDFIPQEAQYYSISTFGTQGENPQSYVPTIDDAKVLPNLMYRLAPVDTEVNPELSGQELTLWNNGDSKVIYDRYAYVYFYDKDRQPLGYVVQLVQFNQNNVPEGFKAIRNTQDEQDYDEDMDASLEHFELEGFTLSDTNGNPKPFDPEVTVYYVPVTDSKGFKSIPVKLNAKSPKASVSYRIDYGESWSEVTKVNTNEFQIGFDSQMPSLPFSIEFRVDTEFAQRNYIVVFMYTYDFQLVTHIGISYYPSPGTGEIRPTYFFTSAFFNPEDIILIYKNENDQEPLYSCKQWQCLLPQELLNPGGPGTFYVSIERNGVKEAKRAYAYDLTPLQRISSDQISLKRLTKDEIEQHNLPINLFWDRVLWYGWQISWSRDKEPSPLLWQAHYYSIHSRPIFTATKEPYPVTVQETKATGKIQDGQFQTDHLYQNPAPDAPNLFIYVIFYDAQRKPIGYVVQRQDFDPAYSYLQERYNGGPGPWLPIIEQETPDSPFEPVQPAEES